MSDYYTNWHCSFCSSGGASDMPHTARLARLAHEAQCPQNPKNVGEKMASRFSEEKKATRKFETGATRSSDAMKPNYEGYVSPLVLVRYGEYMLKHQVQPDGQVRPGDNWQLGITRQSYMESLWRHHVDVSLEHDGYESREGIEDALCAQIFNAMGYLHEILRERGYRARGPKADGEPARAGRPGPAVPELFEPDAERPFPPGEK